MKKTQVSVSLAPELMERIDLYRGALPIQHVSRSSAIVTLIQLGLQAADPQLTLGLPPPPSPSGGGRES
jgi:metal-responsive CopG/Arc/MetJ family transcriptional regulator